MAEFEIRTDTSSLAEKRAKRRQRKTTQLVITGAVIACLIFVVLIVVTSWQGNKEPPAPQTNSRPDAIDDNFNGLKQAEATGADVADPVPMLIDDDGHTMWASPTSGKSIDLGGLPPGCEMFVAIRPAAVLESGEGDKLLAALGPLGKQGKAYIERTTGLRLTEIDQLLLGLRPASDFAIELVLVVTPRADAPTRRPSNHYALADGRFVVAARPILEEVREFAGSPPPLRREMESLVDTTDRDRDVSIVVFPTFLFSDGRNMWQGSLSALRDALFAMLPDSTRGAALSFDVGNHFFAELRLIATIDQRPQRFAEQFAEKVATWPSAVERQIAAVPASPYSAAVVARLPAMLRELNRYQRVGTDSDQSLLRVYLPAVAGHNLLMAGELLLAERFSDGGTMPATTGNASSTTSLEDKLAKRTNLSFARDTLEMAVNLLAADIGAEIVILGGDLQLEGITKNQSFGLDEQDRPASEILIAILRLANPDKTTTSPADPKQKLVYVIGTKPGTSDDPVIFVTTRAQAEKRGDKIPAVFLE